MVWTQTQTFSGPDQDGVVAGAVHAPKTLSIVMGMRNRDVIADAGAEIQGRYRGRGLGMRGVEDAPRTQLTVICTRNRGTDLGDDDPSMKVIYHVAGVVIVPAAGRALSSVTRSGKTGLDLGEGGPKAKLEEYVVDVVTAITTAEEILSRVAERKKCDDLNAVIDPSVPLGNKLAIIVVALAVGRVRSSDKG